MSEITTPGLAQNVDVRIESTRPRVTARPLGARFRDVIDDGAGALLGGVEAASNMVPGGSVVSAAVRGARSGAAGEAAEAPGGGVDGGPQSMADVQRTMMDDNMEYLRLQQQIQAENRRYTTLSNVMKARHETAKNSINNIR